MAKKTATQYTKKEVEKHLKTLSGWKVNPKYTSLTKSFSFSTFVAGLAFSAKITVHAEVLEHHPEITLTYGNVKVTLTTHDAKGLTKKDFELASRIDGLSS
jgi:4a-hydroxytetrahydrobiopterin dehydratase